MRNHQETKVILDAKAATGWGVSMKVPDFRHLVLAVDTASSANLTAVVYGSIQEEEPTWTDSQSASNQFAPVAIVDMDDPSSPIPSSTGIAPTGTDIHKLYWINTDGLVWVNIQVTARSAGSITAALKPFND